MKPGMSESGRQTFKPKRYQRIKTRNPIRFRNTYNRFRVFCSWIPELLRLQDHKDKAYEHYKRSVYITEEDIERVKTVFDFLKHTIGFINYFENDNNFQVNLTMIFDRSQDRSISM